MWDFGHFVRHFDVLQALCLWPATYYLVLLQFIPTRSSVVVETTIKERQPATQEVRERQTRCIVS